MKYLLRAVHRQELENFLKKAGLFDMLLSGKAECSVCSSKVSIENLGAVGKQEGAFVFVCDAHHWEKASYPSDPARPNEKEE